eukprot:scaffold1442_cov128-Cylindrotheca_fusiformis.AAC.13
MIGCMYWYWKGVLLCQCKSCLRRLRVLRDNSQTSFKTVSVKAPTITEVVSEDIGRGYDPWEQRKIIEEQDITHTRLAKLADRLSWSLSSVTRHTAQNDKGASKTANKAQDRGERSNSHRKNVCQLFIESLLVFHIATISGLKTGVGCNQQWSQSKSASSKTLLSFGFANFENVDNNVAVPKHREIHRDHLPNVAARTACNKEYDPFDSIDPTDKDTNFKLQPTVKLLLLKS